MANIFIALPAFGGQIFANCANSIIHLTHTLREQGHQWYVGWVLGESLVPRARNTLVHKFMKTDCTHLLFIDCDVVFKPEHVLGLIAADKELVGGAYPKKALNVENVIQAVKDGEASPLDFAANYAINIDKKRFPIDENGDVTLVPDKGCIPIMDLPTGFMLARRSVFLDMAAQLPEIEHDSDEASTKGEPMFSWFDCAIEDRRYLSEDYLFSRRTQRMGLEAWLYLPAELVHIGTHAYRGDLNKIFRWQTPAAMAKEGSSIGEQIKNLSIPVPTKDDIMSSIQTGKPLDGPWRLEFPPASEYSLPEENGPKYAATMIERYEWAAAHIKGKRIADACSGPGYGIPILEGDGRQCVGFDRAQANSDVALAKGYGFVEVCDVATQKMDGFDSVVTIETIEHLPDPVAWMRGFAPSVKELVVSCPCIPTKHMNEWHLHDFTYDEVINIVTDLGWTVQEHCRQQNDTIMLYAVRP